MQILEDELAAVLYITKAAFCHGFATKRYKTIITILHDTHDIERSFHRFCTFFNDIHVIERYFTATSKLQEIIIAFWQLSKTPIPQRFSGFLFFSVSRFGASLVQICFLEIGLVAKITI